MDLYVASSLFHKLGSYGGSYPLRGLIGQPECDLQKSDPNSAMRSHGFSV